MGLENKIKTMAQVYRPARCTKRKCSPPHLLPLHPMQSSTNTMARTRTPGCHLSLGLVHLPLRDTSNSGCGGTLGSIQALGVVALVPSPHHCAGPLHPGPAPQEAQWLQDSENTHLFLLLVEVVNDDTNEEVQGEEGTEDDEDDKVDVHVEVDLIHWLLFNLTRRDGKHEINPLQKVSPHAPGQGVTLLRKSHGVAAPKPLADAVWVEWSLWKQPQEGTSMCHGLGDKDVLTHDPTVWAGEWDRIHKCSDINKQT